MSSRPLNDPREKETSVRGPNQRAAFVHFPYDQKGAMSGHGDVNAHHLESQRSVLLRSRLLAPTLLPNA